MAMVIPRAFSSGALSMLQKSRYCAKPLKDKTFVIADVRVVLPWSTWPMVPTFTCGLVRWNFGLPMSHALLQFGAHDRIRTGDPVLTKNVLYLLSYVGICFRAGDRRMVAGTPELTPYALSLQTLASSV